jgi:SAM-dependent methyltransferase
MHTFTKSPRVRTTADSWEAAQVEERREWRRQQTIPYIIMRAIRRRSIAPQVLFEDWNEWWKQRFHDYKLVPLKQSTVVEIGCGPYTNVRLMLQTHQIENIYCIDPLAEDYKTLPFSWLKKQSKLGKLHIIAAPGEKVPIQTDLADSLLMINVLDHVQDAIKCLGEAHRILKPGGLFIFGQDLTNDEDMASTGEDKKHPIRLHHEDLISHLSLSFEPLQCDVLGRADGRAPEAHYGTLLYIGKKH